MSEKIADPKVLEQLYGTADTQAGYFRVISRQKITDLHDESVLRESDLCIQDDHFLTQFELVRRDAETKILVKPGLYTMIATQAGVRLEKTVLRNYSLLTTITSSESIKKEAEAFFNNLYIYEELDGDQPKARKILLYSAPGCGKTASIAQYCQDQITVDPGTVVVTWPTAQIDSDDVLTFLSQRAEYVKECTKLILVIEDIGGGEREGSYSSRGVDSALLDILDGMRSVFRVPSLVLATTNYPQNLLSALADRPGRFDLMLELQPPSPDERVALVKFIAKRDITPEEEKAIRQKELNSFSISHLREAIIRSRLHNKTLEVVFKELLEHTKRFKSSFEVDNGKGFGF